MQWIYLSPHFDDIALSCGGLVWEQSKVGFQVQVWTMCAADLNDNFISPFADSLHERWETGIEAVTQRRIEDAASNQAMNAGYRYFSLLDCIYRQDSAGNFLYPSEESLFGGLHPLEEPLVIDLARQLAEAASEGPVNLVAPLGIGGHVDHRLTRAAAEYWQKQDPMVSLWFYPDYPYVKNAESEVSDLMKKGWEEHVFPVTEKGLKVWLEAVAAHRSQISTFWPDLISMQRDIRAYWTQSKGVRLYKEPQNVFQ